MSTQYTNNRGKPKKLYSEAYKFQDLGSYILNYLCPPNTLDTSIAKARSICGLFLTAVSGKFIAQIRQREGIGPKDLLPFPSRAFDSIADIHQHYEKYRRAIKEKIPRNVWRG